MQAALERYFISGTCPGIGTAELQLVQVLSRVISRHAQSGCFEVRSARPQVFQLFLNLHFTREMSFGPLQLFIPFEVAQKLQLLL